jgi:hypothetical protein
VHKDKSGVPATQASLGANTHPGTTPAGSANVAIVTADKGDGFWMAIEEAAHAQPVRAEPGLRWGHPETLDTNVHAQVMGVDLDTLSSHPEEPEVGTHAQTIGAEPDPLVDQPDDPDEGEDVHLASTDSEDLMDALQDWLVEVEEVEVEAADENARVEEGTGPRVDLASIRGHAPHHSVQNRASCPCVVAHTRHIEDGQPAKLSVSHVQARVAREQDGSADSEMPLHGVLPSKRAVETLGPALHERARAPAETGKLLKSSRDEETHRTTRPEDRALMRASEGKMRPGATHGRPHEPPSLCMQSPMARAPNGADSKPEGRTPQARQVDLDGGEGMRSNPWPRTGTVQDAYFRASALLEGEKNNLLLVGSEQAVARPTPNLAQLPVKNDGMPNLGLPGAPAEVADEGEGERATADDAHPARSDPDVPNDPRGQERAFASTTADSEAAGPRMVETRRRINWPAQVNATEPRPPSQKPTRTRDLEGERPWEGINKQQRGTEARQADSMCNAVTHRKTHLPRPRRQPERGSRP